MLLFSGLLCSCIRDTKVTTSNVTGGLENNTKQQSEEIDIDQAETIEDLAEMLSVGLPCEAILSQDDVVRICNKKVNYKATSEEVDGKNCDRIFQQKVDSKSGLNIQVRPFASLASARSSFNFLTKNNKKAKNLEAIKGIGTMASSYRSVEDGVELLHLVFYKNKHLIVLKSLNYLDEDDDTSCVCYTKTKLTALAKQIAPKL